jgi:hypothetical protein
MAEKKFPDTNSAAHLLPLAAPRHSGPRIPRPLMIFKKTR